MMIETKEHYDPPVLLYVEDEDNGAIVAITDPVTAFQTMVRWHQDLYERVTLLERQSPSSGD